MSRSNAGYRNNGNEDDFGNRTSALIQSAESTPAYSYEHGTNSVTMKFTKKSLNPLAKLFIAVGSAVIVSRYNELQQEYDRA